MTRSYTLDLEFTDKYRMARWCSKIFSEQFRVAILIRKSYQEHNLVAQEELIGRFGVFRNFRKKIVNKQKLEDIFFCVKSRFSSDPSFVVSVNVEDVDPVACQASRVRNDSPKWPDHVTVVVVAPFVRFIVPHRQTTSENFRARLFRREPCF